MVEWLSRLVAHSVLYLQNKHYKLLLKSNGALWVLPSFAVVVVLVIRMCTFSFQCIPMTRKCIIGHSAVNNYAALVGKELSPVYPLHTPCCFCCKIVHIVCLLALTPNVFIASPSKGKWNQPT